MREKLLEAKAQLHEAKAQLQVQIDRIDEAIKFFEEYPEMEHMLVAMNAINSVQYSVLAR